MKEPHRILLLALLPIGDSLFATPTIRALRERYPRAEITALVHASTASLMRSVPGVDNVRILPTNGDWRGVRHLIRFLRHLRAHHFDVAIDFTSPAYKWISIVAGIPVRTYMKFDRLWWLIPGRHSAWRQTHATQHYYNCARELGLPPWNEVDHRISLAVSPGARDKAERYLHSHQVGNECRPVVAIHAGARGLGEMKRWPAERYAEVSRTLQRDWHADIVLVGGEEDREIAQHIATMLEEPPLITAGELSLLESLVLLERVALFIGNDSSLLHAAAALGTPYIGIYGPTAPANFHPIPRELGQGSIVMPPVPCKHPHYFVGGDVIWANPRCDGPGESLLDISPEMVEEQAQRLLRKRLKALQPLTGA